MSDSYPDLVEWLRKQREWSLLTFGGNVSYLGIVSHIRKELEEVEESPDDLMEWIDVVILALDGAWRAGYSPEDIAASLWAKQVINMKRKWPDVGSLPPGTPIEHVMEDL
jgi:hypothetical protein